MSSNTAELRRKAQELSHQYLVLSGVRAPSEKVVFAVREHDSEEWARRTMLDAARLLCQKHGELAARASSDAGESVERQEAAFAAAWRETLRELNLP